jgi:hypothetical protein
MDRPGSPNDLDASTDAILEAFAASPVETLVHLGEVPLNHENAAPDEKPGEPKVTLPYVLHGQGALVPFGVTTCLICF